MVIWASTSSEAATILPTRRIAQVVYISVLGSKAIYVIVCVQWLPRGEKHELLRGVAATMGIDFLSQPA